MASKNSTQILIVLISIAILVGMVNIYFSMKSENHILQSTKDHHQMDGLPLSENDKPIDRDGSTLVRGNEADKEVTSPGSTSSSGSGEAQQSQTQSSASQATPTTGSGIKDIDIRRWVNRSIPLTYESGGGAADSIRKQYAHVVEDLKKVQQHLLDGNSEAAMALIRPMLRDRSNIYREDAEWYQILTLLAAGNHDSGLTQLNRLLRDNMHLYYFLGTELHAELVPIQTIMQRSSDQDKKKDRGTGY
nr:hypothetical protein [Saprospiraceae bacterium]